MKADSKHETTAELRAEYEAWYNEQVQLGLKDIEAGRVVSDEDLQRHFDKRFKLHVARQQKQAA